MRVLVLGGTRFIGRATVVELVRAGYVVMVVHRGQSEPDDLPPVEHVHVDRADLSSVAGELTAFAADAVEVLPPGIRIVVLSSMDVYRAYGALLAGTVSDPVPAHERSPVRQQRYPFRGQGTGMDDYEKLDIEEQYLARRATVCRLPMVYGERDGQRREEFVLRRVRAGPGERRTASVELWARMILEAAGAEADLVRVPTAVLPADLGISANLKQHLLCDSAKTRHLLGWEDRSPMDALRRSVAWHLAHPPDDDGDFSADDAALAQA